MKEKKIKESKDYIIVLYDSVSDYAMFKADKILHEWRDFITYLLNESGEKAKKEDFSLFVGDCYKHMNAFESGPSICQFMSILFEHSSETNSKLLAALTQKEVSHMRARIKSLVEAIREKKEISEYILRKY